MQVVSLLTQTTVSPDDPAFEDPQKFIGPMYSKEDADRCASGAFQTAGGLPGDQGRRRPGSLARVRCRTPWHPAKLMLIRARTPCDARCRARAQPCAGEGLGRQGGRRQGLPARGRVARAAAGAGGARHQGAPRWLAAGAPVAPPSTTQAQLLRVEVRRCTLDPVLSMVQAQPMPAQLRHWQGGSAPPSYSLS